MAISVGIAMLSLGMTGVARAAFDPWQMVHPLGGAGTYTNSFGDCRGSNCSRSHEGEDIMAPKGTPVYAVADGVVNWISDSPTECCFLGLDHGGGWLTRYIHLNDDVADGNGGYVDHTDGQGWGIAPGIVEGSPVSAGQLIGWVGDSGNAPEGVTHLHFELRRYSGSQWDSYAIDPYPYLAGAGPTVSYSGQFSDDDGNYHEADIEKIYAAGITYGCNADNSMYCPDQSITRGEMAAFLRRHLELPNPAEDYYGDDNANQFQADINAITAAGIGFGCGPNAYCPDQPLRREEFAEMFARAFGYTNPTETDWFNDDNASVYEQSINALKAVDVTKGCDPANLARFCPTSHVDRAQMASFLVRALGL